MKRLVFLIFLGVAFVGSIVGQTKPAFRVEFHQVSPHAWVHTSWALYNGTPTPSNGMIWVGSNSVILVDTAWDQAQTDQVLDFIANKFLRPVAICFITHSHEDRSAGLPRLLAKGIKVCMNIRTRDLLALDPALAGLLLQTDGVMAIADTKIDVRFPGAAHAPDNISLWFPEDKLLYGACIIKSADASGMGNVLDADLGSWRRVISWLQSTYPAAAVVVPGHGAVGGAELLAHTSDLLRAYP